MNVSRETPIRRFITGTSTGVGKTYVTRGITAAMRSWNLSTAALKPFETGCDPTAEDATALAAAAARPELANIQGFYRARLPLSPYAAELEGHPPADVEHIASLVTTVATHYDACMVEGAGGLLVPLTETHTIGDLAAELAFPLIIVAPNRLGVQSDTLATVESAHARGLLVDAVVLVDLQTPYSDERESLPPTQTNHRDPQNSLIPRNVQTSSSLEKTSLPPSPHSHGNFVSASESLVPYPNNAKKPARSEALRDYHGSGDFFGLDPSVHTNVQVLRKHLPPIPIFSFPHCSDDTPTLGRAAVASGLAEHCLRQPASET